jgi:hypothetical protein
VGERTGRRLRLEAQARGEVVAARSLVRVGHVDGLTCGRGEIAVLRAQGEVAVSVDHVLFVEQIADAEIERELVLAADLPFVANHAGDQRVAGDVDGRVGIDGRIVDGRGRAGGNGIGVAVGNGAATAVVHTGAELEAFDPAFPEFVVGENVDGDGGAESLAGIDDKVAGIGVHVVVGIGSAECFLAGGFIAVRICVHEGGFDAGTTIGSYFAASAVEDLEEEILVFIHILASHGSGEFFGDLRKAGVGSNAPGAGEIRDELEFIALGNAGAGIADDGADVHRVEVGSTAGAGYTPDIGVVEGVDLIGYSSWIDIVAILFVIVGDGIDVEAFIEENEANTEVGALSFDGGEKVAIHVGCGGGVEGDGFGIVSEDGEPVEDGLSAHICHLRDLLAGQLVLRDQAHHQQALPRPVRLRLRPTPPQFASPTLPQAAVIDVPSLRLELFASSFKA